jgi:hypothetical protein
VPVLDEMLPNQQRGRDEGCKPKLTTKRQGRACCLGRGSLALVDILHQLNLNHKLRLVKSDSLFLDDLLINVIKQVEILKKDESEE